MKKSVFLGTLSLLLAAFFWGTTFVAQDVGMDFVGPFTFQSVRSFVGCFFLFPITLVLDYFKFKKGIIKKENKLNCKSTIIGGICCGIVLSIAACFQQFGIKYSTVGKAGFITALYVIFVPLCSIFLKKKVRPIVFISAFLALIGLYLLCMTESFSLSLGDTLLLICAISYTAHIIVIDKFSIDTDPIKMSCIQFFVAGVIAAFVMFIFEKPSLEQIYTSAFPILYAGILSSGVAYTLQIVGQKYTEPTIASLLMSLESVFAVLSGAVVLNEIPSISETFGCIILFLAIILAQLPSKKSKKNANI